MRALGKEHQKLKRPLRDMEVVQELSAQHRNEYEMKESFLVLT